MYTMAHLRQGCYRGLSWVVANHKRLAHAKGTWRDFGPFLKVRSSLAGSSAPRGRQVLGGQLQAGGNAR